MCPENAHWAIVSAHVLPNATSQAKNGPKHPAKQAQTRRLALGLGSPRAIHSLFLFLFFFFSGLTTEPRSRCLGVCRRDVPVLAAAAAGAVRVGPGADPRDRALRVAGHGQAHLPAEGPGAPLRPRRPQGQRRRVAPPAQGHRPRVLHGQGQGKVNLLLLLLHVTD
jgi:hypothetical protein